MVVSEPWRAILAVGIVGAWEDHELKTKRGGFGARGGEDHKPPRRLAAGRTSPAREWGAAGCGFAPLRGCRPAARTPHPPSAEERLVQRFFMPCTSLKRPPIRVGCHRSIGPVVDFARRGVHSQCSETEKSSKFKALVMVRDCGLSCEYCRMKKDAKKHDIVRARE